MTSKYEKTRMRGKEGLSSIGLKIGYLVKNMRKQKTFFFPYYEYEIVIEKDGGSG